MNISSMSVGRLTEQLSNLYIAAVEAGTDPKRIPAVFIHGAPGLGKSSAIGQIAENIEKATGKTVKVTDIRLLLMTPIDLIGIPAPDSTHQFTDFLRPRMFELEDSEDVYHLLFFDELNAASSSMQGAAYQLILDRRIGTHELARNCFVIAAGNRMNDRSVVNRMPLALANRMMHIEVEPDYESWSRWAVQNGINAYVRGYLAFDNAKLYVELEDRSPDDPAFPTPRSWQFVSDLLNVMSDQPPYKLHDLIAGAIGTGTALAFEQFCKVYYKMPSADAILEGRELNQLPKEQDVLYALLSVLSFKLTANVRDVTDSAIENACRYVEKIPLDFAAKFYFDVMSVEEMKLRMASIPAYQKWLKKNRTYL